MIPVLIFGLLVVAAFVTLRGRKQPADAQPADSLTRPVKAALARAGLYQAFEDQDPSFLWASLWATVGAVGPSSADEKRWAKDIHLTIDAMVHDCDDAEFRRIVKATDWLCSPTTGPLFDAGEWHWIDLIVQNVMLRQSCKTRVHPAMRVGLRLFNRA